eukprot:TRINITY_DN2775_c1_g1_i1.p1 TRINITY_DN2775_c1_g1~~TRINITY_DN2775_c1_g1_i1.p1  ORF type:complete len:515 (+),score=65.02 TRINITY_DN2775_c1_g1_i1:72-1616(+)
MGDVQERTRLVDSASVVSHGGFLDKILPEGSMQAGVFNIASATLGAGALTLPYAFKKSGLGMGITWLAAGMLATVFSIKLLIQVLEVVRHSPAWKGPRNLDSYEDLTLHLFGRKTEYFVEAQIIVFCYGTAIAYVVAVGDILDPVRKLDMMPSFLSYKYGRQLVMIIFWTFLMLPLSFLKSVNSLRFSSMLGVVSILILVAASIYHCSTNRFEDWSECGSDSGSCDTDISWVEFDIGMVLTVPLIMLAYTCQVNVFSIYNELKDPSPAKMMKISWLGMGGLCFVVYGLMGTFGYLDFLGDTKGNVLKNLDPSTNAFIAIAFVAIALTVVVAFPLVVFPCRDSIFNILMAHKSVNERQELLEDAQTHLDKYEVASTSSSHVYMPGPGAAGGAPRVYLKPSDKMHFGISFSISFSALVFALLIPEIQVVFSFLGGVCSSYLCFFLPAAFIKKLKKIEDEYYVGPLHDEEKDSEADPDLWDAPGISNDIFTTIGIELLYYGGIVAGVGSTVVTAITL